YYDEYGIDLYDENRRDPSPAGSYLTAAITYAQTFGKTPYGSDVYGKLSEADALLLQKVAHEFVFGEEVPEITTKKSAVLFIEPDTTPSAIKTGDTYHENYKYLYETALSYRAHGKFIEYDQYGMNPYVLGSVVYRREPNSAPEFASPQRTVHLDCSAFVYAVYKQAFNYEFFHDTGVMINITEGEIFDSGTLYDYKGETPAPEVLETAKQTFIDTLQPGDAVVYRHKDDWGHTMIYLGNGTFIHCSSGNRFSGSGSDYNFTGRYDLNDIPGDVYYNDITNLINPTQSRYLFGGSYRVKIFRLFDLGLTPTANAEIRVNRLSGISAYKLTSAPEGVTVNPGDDVEFTVVVKNYGDSAKTLALSETLPSGFTYSTGTGNVSFTINAGETKTVAYKVRVPSSQAAGTYGVTTALEGLALTDTPIHVAKTLTASQKAALVSAAEAALASSATDIAFIKAAYSAGLSKTISYADAAAVYTSFCNTIDATHRRRNASDSYVLENGSYVIDPNKAAQLKTALWTSTLRAPNLYGGKAFKSTSPTLADRRVKNLNGFNFVTGDILVVADDVENTDVTLYLCLGENRFATVKNGSPYTVNDSSAARQFLDRVWGADAFFVVRPSKSF
ncbi:MAG: C40 family peptidase, partial [Clostridia bacterium]|nr:C40 family peptidase [Clostridia bacterium]